MRSVAANFYTLLAVLSMAGCAHKAPPVAEFQPIKDVKSDDRRSELGIAVPVLHSDTVVLVSTLDHTLQPRGTTPVYPPKTVTSTAPTHRTTLPKVVEPSHAAPTAPTIPLPVDIGQPRDDAQKLRDTNPPSDHNLTPVRVAPGVKTSSVQPSLTPDSVLVASSKQKISDVPNFQPVLPVQSVAPATAPTISSDPSVDVKVTAESAAATSSSPASLESSGSSSQQITPAPTSAVIPATNTPSVPEITYHKVEPIIEKQAEVTLALSSMSDMGTKQPATSTIIAVESIPVAPQAPSAPLVQTNAIDPSGKPVVVASNTEVDDNNDADHLDKLWAAYCEQGEISFEDEMRLTKLPIPDKFRGNCFPPK